MNVNILPSQDGDWDVELFIVKIMCSMSREGVTQPCSNCSHRKRLISANVFLKNVSQNLSHTEFVVICDFRTLDAEWVLPKTWTIFSWKSVKIKFPPSVLLWKFQINFRRDDTKGWEPFILEGFNRCWNFSANVKNMKKIFSR